ncbi:hypothetical protein ACHAXT_010414 [Thalassiosira profunda]
MTTLREEDDLFGASLSADFYQSSRPWQRAAPAPAAPAAPVAPAARRLDPYELLDEVPDAPAHGDPVGGGGPLGNAFDFDGAQGDPVGGGNPFEGAPSPRPPTPAAGRYPLDDDLELDHEAFSVPSKIDAPASPGWEVESQPTFEVDSRASSKGSSVHRNHGYPSRQEQEPQQELALVESRSDSEVSEYVPMHAASYERQESEDIVEEESLPSVAGGDGASERGARMEGESEASVGSFDRLYDDADAMDLEGSAGAAPGAPVPKTPAAVSPRSEAGAEQTPAEDPRWAHVRSPGFTPAGTPDGASADVTLEASPEATPEEDPKWTKVKVDVPAAAPPRSHPRGPSSPYERHDALADGSSSDEPLDGNPFALLASPGTTVTPAYSYGSGLAGEPPTEASDDHPFAPSPGGWAPGTPAAYSFGSGIAGTPDSHDSHGSHDDSRESDDSAIGALRSLQPDGGRSVALSDGPFDEPVSPMDSSTERSADAPPPSPPVRHPPFVSGPSNAKVKREDPPAEDPAYYPPNKHAPEPEGYRHRELFPDIDLATGKPPASVQEEAARVLAAADAFIGAPVGADDEAMPAAGEATPAMSDGYTTVDGVDEVDGYSDVGPPRRSFELDDCYESMHGGDRIAPGGAGGDLARPHTGDRAAEGYCEGEPGEAGGFQAGNGRIARETLRPAAAAACNDDNEDMDVDSTSDASTSLEGMDPSIVSVLSDATNPKPLPLRGAAAAAPPERGANRRRPKAKLARYDVKRGDSLEGDVRIEFGDGATTAAPLGGKRPVPEAAPYGGVRDGDSMEDLGVRFESNSQDTAMTDGSDDATEEDDKGNTVASPPAIERRPFRFEAGTVSADGAADESSTTSSGSVPSETSSCSSEEDGGDCTDDESAASGDPTIFPPKALSQMNRGRHLARADSSSEADASEDLAEQACRHLARGRNDAALAALTAALDQARARVDLAKRKVDAFHSRKNRRAPDDEREERLDADLRGAASDMADALNNLGVVYELIGDPQSALSAFRDALDAYRSLARRYENSGDADVDRTVGNLLQVGMALRSRAKREELHAEAEGLAGEARRWRSSDEGRRAQVRTERLHVLGGVLDLEAESLGREHPEVGYTLLKRGALHLEMRHYDLAIKDTRDACDIFTKSLGKIHPDTGLALVRLADLYNHEVGPGYEGDSDNRATALSLYQEAVRPLRESFGRVNSPLGSVYNSIGIICAAQGDFRRAKASFYEALASYGVRRKDRAPAITGRSCPDVFYVWINVGGLHRDQGQWPLALRSWRKAQSSFLSLDEASRAYLQQVGPRSLMPHALASTSGGAWPFEDNDALLAALLQGIGTAHSMLHQYGKAVEALEEALRLHQVVALRTGDARHVARLLENLGEVQMTRGDLTSAFERYLASLDLLRRCHGDASVEVALVFGAIGRVHRKKGEYAAARVILKQSMRTFEAMGVPPSNRRVNEIRSCLVDSELALMQTATSTLAGQRRELSSAAYEDKALAVDELADACRNRGDLSEALWFYSEALDIRRRRVEQLSGGRQAGEIVDVGRTVSNIAQLRCERREFGAAKILFDEAKQLYNDAGLATEHPFYQDLVQEIDVMRKM